MEEELGLAGTSIAELSREELRRAKRLGLSDSAIARALEDRRIGGAATPARTRPGARLQDDRYVRGRVRSRDALFLLDLRGRERVDPDFQAQGRDPRRRPQPNRPGHRVRLLLRSCLLRAVGGRIRNGHDQLQPGDRVDGLRHVRPSLFRALDLRRRLGRARQRKARRRPRPIRRPDALEARAAAGGGGLPDSGARRPTRSIWPRIAAASGAFSRSSDSPLPSTRRRARSPTRSPRRGASVIR